MQNHHSTPDQDDAATTDMKGRDTVLLALLFGAVGAITWAIRGTSGWGGIDGAIVPGMAWGVLWFWTCWRLGIDARSETLWLGLGIAIGGEWGYGQYVSWIRGSFETDGGLIAISPAIGGLWFVLVGIAWGGPGGIILGWALSGRASLQQWLARILIPLGVAMAGRLLIQARPAWFFPHHDSGIYPVPEAAPPATPLLQTQTFMFCAWCLGGLLLVTCLVLGAKNDRRPGLFRGVCVLAVVYTAITVPFIGHWLFFPNDNLELFSDMLGRHLGRTVYTNAQNALVVFWWVGALMVALAQRDRATLAMGLIIGAGFGAGMLLSALWRLGYIYAPGYIDWWKVWELNAGFNLGVLYLGALLWSLRHGYRRDAVPRETPHPMRPLAAAFAVVLLWLYLYVEDGLLAGLFLGPLYFASAQWVSWRSAAAHRDRNQRQLSLIFCVFYLLFFLFHGVTDRLGVVLGLFSEESVDQYQWPVARLWLFVLPATLLILWTVTEVWRLPRQESLLQHIPARATRYIVDLILLTGLVGAITIWPSQIAILYALLMLVAVASLLRLSFQNLGTEAA